ncbi:N-acetylmuramic acid 6-phosphate etherase [Cryomorpha ignava]|uniref:N-acetylmuramic acid 6-phosphate etherase n=1 Tax=Cryomorpha ignava TaxID=101383 RepID=A0A7K3WPR2_9FLAO|nr:N-acetylmuramic acid 6-phosphate etherase [Cryomorpha ignava]NEN23637.1 N-acetylmuramic acid 6-phosphate etherase [Cryomorpha ignava]
MERQTEKESLYNNLEGKSILEILTDINREDAKIAAAVNTCIPKINTLVIEIAKRISEGGRLFYTGAGTSGRLGIVDASECPPTFGVPHGMVIGLMAGGDSAMRKAVEFAEDDETQGWDDLKEYKIDKLDTVIGIAASGTTPYVIGALRNARQHGILTGCITCNPGSPIGKEAEFPIEVAVGPEYVTGSTRMKSGTAQKLVLNMISTAVMIKLGRVKGNKMVDMQLSNNKLVDRGTRMVMNELDINYELAKELLLKYGSVRNAVINGSN